jgi:hypothetical protein
MDWAIAAQAHNNRTAIVRIFLSLRKIKVGTYGYVTGGLIAAMSGLFFAGSGMSAVGFRLRCFLARLPPN